MTRRLVAALLVDSSAGTEAAASSSLHIVAVDAAGLPSSDQPTSWTDPQSRQTGHQSDRIGQSLRQRRVTLTVVSLSCRRWAGRQFVTRRG